MRIFLLVSSLFSTTAFAGTVDIACPDDWSISTLATRGWSVDVHTTKPTGHKMGAASTSPPNLAVGAKAQQGKGGALVCGNTDRVVVYQPKPAAFPNCEGKTFGFECTNLAGTASTFITCPSAQAGPSTVNGGTGTWTMPAWDPYLLELTTSAANLHCRYGAYEPIYGPTRLPPQDTPYCSIRDDGNGYTCSNLPPASSKEGHQVKVRFVTVADDDGSNEASYNYEQGLMAIRNANKAWEKIGLPIQLSIDERSNFTETGKPRRNSLMNIDCVPLPNVDLSVEDANGDGVGDKEDRNSVCRETEVVAVRKAEALSTPDVVTIIVRKKSMQARFEDGKWVVGKQESFASTGNGLIYSGMGIGGGTIIHELGHLLGLGHTFRYRPKTIEDAAAIMTPYVVIALTLGANPQDPASVFDGDDFTDTAPITRPDLYENVTGLGKCDGDGKIYVPMKVSVPTPFGNAEYDNTVVIEGDRSNVMSYYRCGDATLSPQQQQRMLTRLKGSQQRLIRPELASCYATHGYFPEHANDDPQTLQVLIPLQESVIDACIAGLLQ